MDSFTNVYVLFRTDLHKVNLILIRYCFTLFLQNLSPYQVTLVSYEHYWQIIRCVLLNLLQPDSNRAEGVSILYTIYKEDSHGTPVEVGSDCSKFFLSCSVPELYEVLFVIDFDDFIFVLDSYGCGGSV